MVSAYNESYWLQKDAWSDTPSYAQDIDIGISPTNLIQKRNYREKCTSYTNTTSSNGSTITKCDNYVNESYSGSGKKIIDIVAGNSSYLGNGNVRTKITFSGNELSKRTLLAGSDLSYLVYGELFTKNDYVSWFNQRYYYNNSNITVSDLEVLKDKIKNISATGQKTSLKASRIRDVSFSQQKGIVFDSTIVLHFNNFSSGTINLSNLLNIEVNSEIA